MRKLINRRSGILKIIHLYKSSIFFDFDISFAYSELFVIFGSRIYLDKREISRNYHLLIELDPIHSDRSFHIILMIFLYDHMNISLKFDRILDI